MQSPIKLFILRYIEMLISTVWKQKHLKTLPCARRLYMSRQNFVEAVLYGKSISVQVTN